MSITLYHHPFSRAAGAVWMLEEVEAKYDLHFIDIMAGGQKSPDVVKLNPMGKLPTLVDGDTVVTELAAVGLYLADRYAYDRLAPRVDDPKRGTYYRWSFFSPSVIEPGSMAKASGWEYREGAAGWGSHEAMLTAIESAVTKGDYILGDRFSMADVVLGGTLRYMMMFKMLEAKPAFSAYVERLTQRPAFKRAEDVNAKVVKDRGLKMPGAT